MSLLKNIILMIMYISVPRSGSRVKYNHLVISRSRTFYDGILLFTQMCVTLKLFEKPVRIRKGLPCSQVRIVTKKIEMGDKNSE